MIIGTAGHIDHGKTTLVHALTGVDTDRLPEEKKRGISIELGYAFLDVPGSAAAGRIGFIDVPGHERLVHTMLAGATGIDFALLLVAADDGVMPQTREHLAVLSLLGISRGAVAITKADRADGARIDEVRAQVDALLARSALAGVPVLPVSAQTGIGIAPLREMLFDAARATPARSEGDSAFRLAIDRAFTLDGVGTVVTGTVHAGQVQVGDELALTPSTPALTARVRSLHAQNRAVTRAQAGERCAVALVGIDKEQVSRGQWLVARDSAIATDRIDAGLTLWHDEAKALRSGTPVHVHIGAADVLGTVAILDVQGGDAKDAAQSMAPGASAHVQLVLHHPVGAWHGDRIVLRDNSGSRTLAGGRVLDPFAPVRYRRTPQRLAELRAWSQPDATARLASLIDAAPHGVSLRRWALAEGLPSQAMASLPQGALHAAEAEGCDWALAASHRRAAQDGVLAALGNFHQREPNTLGPDAGRLRRLAAPRWTEPLWRALLADLRAQGHIGIRGAFVHLPEHGLRLTATDERLAQKVRPLMSTAGFEGSWVRDLARDTHENEALMRTTLARLAQRGEMHQVVKDLYYPPDSMARMAAILRKVAAGADGEVTAAQFRDATGLGRKRAIHVLEFFDRTGLLRRVGDAHRLRSDTSLFSEGTS
ncbi:selenocysteine-specific translation elongation factor [Variovorax sp. GT1P44]|uniref:selenocysteine-specific translation elongation factor n=1 Tax=Variovorax sp. GT1P44 TaxID=3443742 RepID=UPI003F482168